MANPELHAPSHPVGQMTGGEEYPKMLYKGDADDYEHRIVEDIEEEIDAVEDGWRVDLFDADIKSTAVAMADKDAEIEELRRQLAEASKPRVGRPPKVAEEELTKDDL